MDDKKSHGISSYIEGLAKHSSDIFWIKNTDFNRQIYISPAYEKIWGRSCDTMYRDPKSWTDYIFPEDLERLHATIERCRQHITRDTRYTETYRIKRPDGKVLWIREKGFSIYDDFGNLIGFGGVGQDITSQKKNQKVEAEVQILSQERNTYEEYLRSIIDSIAGNHWWKDKDGVYLGYNRALLRSLGYKSPDDIIGKTDYELTWSDQADHLVTHDREVMRRGVSIEREELVTANDGQERIYLVNKAPLRNPKGEIIGTIGHGFDITYIKKAQQALEDAKIALEKEKDSVENRLNAVIETLVGVHWMKDLEGRYLACNNYIAQQLGLSGASEMIGKTDYELPWADHADEMTAFDKEVLSRGAQMTKETTERFVDGKIHHFLVTKAPLCDQWGELIGIIASATDITDQKGVESELKQAKEVAEAEKKEKEHQMASLNQDVRTPLNVISGSVEILQSKVVDPALKSALDDLREATQNLLGKLNVQSVPEPSTPELKQKPAEAVTTVSFDRCRILVVEDNLLNQKVTKVLLEDLGCSVTIAGDGKEALALVGQQPFDLVFMDVGLPGMDGIEVTQNIWLSEDTKELPVVALTAHVIEEELARCRDAGLDIILTKPVSSVELKEVLVRYCPHRSREFMEIPV